MIRAYITSKQGRYSRRYEVFAHLRKHKRLHVKTCYSPMVAALTAVIWETGIADKGGFKK